MTWFNCFRYEGEYLCSVMDGQLLVHEQDVFTFARFLPNILIPAPLGYVKKIIAIVTIGAWACHQIQPIKIKI